MAGEEVTVGVPECVRRPHSPSALVAFTACVYRTELERAANAALVSKPPYKNVALDGLVQSGPTHEQAHLKDLRAHGPDIVDTPEVPFSDAPAVAEAVRLTAAALTARRDVYQRVRLALQRLFAMPGHFSPVKPSASWAYR